MREHAVQLRYEVRSESTKFWVPDGLTLSAGWLERGKDSASFISFGPTYRKRLGRNDWGRWFADFGSVPTYIGHTYFSGKPLGGKFFFTTYFGLGAYLDWQRRTSVLLRYQHISNAGLNHSNPGVDLVGLSVSYHFGNN